MRSLDQKMEEGTKLERRRSCYRTAVEVLKKKGFNRLRLVSTLHASGVLLDYFLVYIVKMDDDNKCIELNYSLGFTALALRWLLEILNIIIFCTMFNFKKFNFTNFMAKVLRTDTMKYMSRLLLGIAITRKEFRDFLMFHQFLSVLLVAVVFQVMMMISLTTSKKGLILIALYYLVGLHLPRLCGVIAILLKRPKTSSSRFRTKLLRLFFFVFMYSIQLFAALWYLTAIYKEIQCWNQAHKYLTHTSSDYYGFGCHEMTSETDYNLKANVSDYCQTNTTEYVFGIYELVHQSGILRKESSLPMILYFSRWAMQYLSSFAQGLEAGDSVWQNIFIIFIIVYAVFMFFFLIGEVQSEKEKFAKLKPKLREKKRWMELKELPGDLQSKLRKNERSKWPAIKDVNIEDMFNNLPKDVSGKLSQQLCLDRIKKVKEFEKWSEASLKDLCDCIKPIFYAKGTRVIREGDPIDEMIFVVQGVLWTYSSRGRTTGPQITSNCTFKNDHLKVGDFCGEELVNCTRNNPYSFESPISTKTIQAGTDVEAFVIMVYDLKNIFIKHLLLQAVLFLQFRWRFIRLLRSRRNAQSPGTEANTTNTVSAVCVDCGLISLLKNNRLICSSCVSPQFGQRC